MFRPGQMVGLYTLIVKLGRGGFGEVWLAEKRSQFVTKKVAVKLPHEEQVNFDAIHQEATLWEQASGHPNVLPIIDADVYDGQVVIVSEYAEGGSLADKLTREEKLSVRQSVEMSVGILSGLEFLHSRKIIHRDIKPANILLQGNTPRLADFGISRAMQTTVVSSAIIGTDAYMSPESFDGVRSAQTDIWSVGVVLYQLLKGSLPFPQEHPSERMFAVLTKDFAPLPDDVPPDLRNIVQKALQKQPENRFQTAEEMRHSLERALVAIAHPTLARTEILERPIQYVEQSSAETEESGEPYNPLDKPTEAFETQTDVTEIKTFAVKAQDNQISAEPAPTQAAFVQNSVVTQIKPSNFIENNPADETALDKSEAVSTLSITRPKKYGYVIAFAFGAIFLLGLFTVFIYNFSNKNKPESKISSTIDEKSALRNLIPFELNKKYGFADVSKKTVVPPKYEDARKFSEGMAQVKLNGKWGYIDNTGREVIPPKYDTTFDFKEDFAGVRLGDKAGFIDKTGNVVIPIVYEYASEFHEGLAGAALNNKHGFIDKTGKTVIPFQYGMVFYFKDGVAVVCRDKVNIIDFENCGIVDKTGKELTPLKYDYISVPSEGLLFFKLDDKFGFMDLTGREVIPAKYYSADKFSGGYAEVMHEPGEKLFIDKNGTEFKSKPANTTKTP